MSKILLNLIIVLASILLLTGVIFSFINLDIVKIKINNSGYVAAIFSMSGVLLYFAALMYQIKEYKLQVEELKKSVQAQTKSSEALDEQKRILIEQNANSLIFEMIESFNSFKERNKMYSMIHELIGFYQNIFAHRWNDKLNGSELNFRDLNIQYAHEIKDILNETVPKHDFYFEFKRFIQFVYNILIVKFLN